MVADAIEHMLSCLSNERCCLLTEEIIVGKSFSLDFLALAMLFSWLAPECLIRVNSVRQGGLKCKVFIV